MLNHNYSERKGQKSNTAKHSQTMMKLWLRGRTITRKAERPFIKVTPQPPGLPSLQPWHTVLLPFSEAITPQA